MPAFFDLKGYGHLLLEGALVTLSVGVAAMAVALTLGILGALARLSPRPMLQWIGAIYVVVIRGIPELVLMLLVYYGGTVLLHCASGARAGAVHAAWLVRYRGATPTEAMQAVAPLGLWPLPLERLLGTPLRLELATPEG